MADAPNNANPAETPAPAGAPPEAPAAPTTPAAPPPAAVTIPAAASPAAPVAETPVATQPRRPAKRDAKGAYWGTGRRKSSIARVRLLPGDGKITINERTYDQYFTVPQHRAAVLAPLEKTESARRFNVIVNVSGGGITGQAGAVRMGLARALLAAEPKFEEALRDSGYLTRDSRVVERKKPGQRKARRRFQFSKR